VSGGHKKQEERVIATTDFTSPGMTAKAVGKQTGERVRPTQQEIAQRAYELFVVRGRADGHDVDDWLIAERELKHHYSAA
jgi:Protein of unknown function (DUF2934)